MSFATYHTSGYQSGEPNTDTWANNQQLDHPYPQPPRALGYLAAPAYITSTEPEYTVAKTEGSEYATYHSQGPSYAGFFAELPYFSGYDGHPFGPAQPVPEPYETGENRILELADDDGIDDSRAVSIDLSNLPSPGDDDMSHNSDESDVADEEARSATTMEDDASSVSRRSGADRSEGSPSTSSGSRKRRRFTEEERQETSKTRSKGVCLRCRMQRIRCAPNPDPEDADDDSCQACAKVSHRSKKVIHHVPCKRWKLIETVWYRRGGLDLTQRWQGTRVRDIKDYADKLSHTIEVKVLCRDLDGLCYDLCDEPLRYHVRKFMPKAGDLLDRHWVKRLDNDRTEKWFVPIGPYALVSLANTQKYLTKYFDNYTLAGVRKAVSASEPLVQHMFDAALRHWATVEDAEERSEKQFLQKLFKLWFITRMATGSAYLTGEEKLDQTPVLDKDYPLGDRLSIPRMVTAQCDGLLVERFLKPLSEGVLKQLEEFIKTNDHKYFYTVFLATFILLHEVAYSSADRYRHARENGVEDYRYSLPLFVHELQFGANIVLLHWHYYKCDLDPHAENLKKTRMSKLNAEQVDVVRTAFNLLGKRPEHKPIRNQRWEDPLFFAAQMFRNDWEPSDGYSGQGWW